jgi:hypothetical protein
MLKNMRRAAVISATVALVGISVAPAAHAAKAPQPDLVWYLGSPDRSIVDLPPTGPSLGDITVTNGDVSELPGKISIGFYSTNQTTVRVNIPGGREIRDVDLAISAPGGFIYATALIRANSGTPPTKAQTFAIVGGTGKYSGVSGQAIHSGFTAQGSKIEFFFVN